MRPDEIIKYLEHADPNLDLVVLNRKKYEGLLRKAKMLDLIRKEINQKIK